MKKKKYEKYIERGKDSNQETELPWKVRLAKFIKRMNKEYEKETIR